MSHLHTSLLKRLSANGWLVRSDGRGLSAERQGLLKKWLFGKRSITLHLELKFDEFTKTVFYGESTVEASTGLTPRHHDPLVGMAEHDEARRWVEQDCKLLGWRFAMMPRTVHPPVASPQSSNRLVERKG